MVDEVAADILSEGIDALSVNRQFVYARKGPADNLSRCLCADRLPDTGLTGFDIRAWRIKKDWLGTGQRVRLLDEMAGSTLDGLLFGNRKGTELVNAIRDEALKPFRAWEKKQARHRG